MVRCTTISGARTRSQRCCKSMVWQNKKKRILDEGLALQSYTFELNSSRACTLGNHAYYWRPHLTPNLESYYCAKKSWGPNDNHANLGLAAFRDRADNPGTSRLWLSPSPLPYVVHQQQHLISASLASHWLTWQQNGLGTRVSVMGSHRHIRHWIFQ